MSHFGEDILLPDGYLDRPKLGAIVFNDEAQRKKLNGIVHPAVWRAMFWAVLRAWARGSKVCVLDTPLLIEGGLWKWMGKVVNRGGVRCCFPHCLRTVQFPTRGFVGSNFAHYTATTP